MNENRPYLKNARSLLWLIVLIVGIGAGYRLLSQTLAERPIDAPPWAAIAIVFVTVVALIVSQQERNESIEASDGVARPMATWLRQTVELAGRYWRIVALALAVLLVWYTLSRIPALVLPDDSFRNLLITWALAFALYLAAVTQFSTREPIDWSRWWLAHRREVLLAGGVTLLALVLRVWRLESIPFTLAGDEGSQGLEAIRVLEGKINNPFNTGWLGVPTMSFFFNSITIKLLGRTILGLRLPWALIGTTAVLVTFFLVKRLKNTTFALAVAFLLATYHYHIHFSRLGSNQVADPFFLVLSLFFLYRALDEGRRFDWALTGGITGLAFYFYAGARLTAVVLAAVIAYEFIRQPRQFWQQHRLGLLVMLGGFLLVAGPMMQYAIRFPDDFNARLNAVGIIQSGWLEQEVDIRQQSVATILFDQFRRAALAFTYYPDRTVWYGLPQPLLSPFFGILFLFGLLYATIRLVGRWADARSAPMVAWWWTGMILGGMLTESPPSSQRLITLAIPVCYFIGLALWEWLQLSSKAFRGVPIKALLAIAVLAFGINSLMTYFSEYIPQRIYGGPHAELATEIAPQLRELAASHRFYFVGPPAMYWGFATLPYLVPQADAVDITESLAEPLSWDVVMMDKGAVFIFLPQRLNELSLAQRTFPEGEIFDYYSPVDGRLLVTLYVVPSAVRN